ncbi:MAG: hypothetical protein QOE61_5652, partial [Micromonosporaceae bacterium]|nr:hypothetical protein [Micromonosporaceae bacterium]
MRRITLFIVSTVASLVFLFSYHTSTGPSAPAAVAVGPGPVGIVPGSDPVVATSGSGSAAAPATKTLTVNGIVAQTRWGPVQVQVTIKSGKITDIRAIQYPNGNDRDQEINSYALPELHDQVLAAQSANIDGVSGATVTSGGYQQSLQAALDTAHFG